MNRRLPIHEIHVPERTLNKTGFASGGSVAFAHRERTGIELWPFAQLPLTPLRRVRPRPWEGALGHPPFGPTEQFETCPCLSPTAASCPSFSSRFLSVWPPLVL